MDAPGSQTICYIFYASVVGTIWILDLKRILTKLYVCFAVTSINSAASTYYKQTKEISKNETVALKPDSALEIDLSQISSTKLHKNPYYYYYYFTGWLLPHFKKC